MTEPSLQHSHPATDGRASTVAIIIDALSRDWRTLVRVPAWFAIVAAVVVLVVPQVFTIHAAFLGDTGSSGLQLSSGLAALASQFGVNASLGAIPPDFYGDLVTSRTVLEPVARTTYSADPRMGSGPSSGTLMDLYDVSGKTDEEKMENLLKVLQKQLDVSVDRVTSVVSIDFETRWPTLGKSVVDSILVQVDHFNQQLRRAAAHEQRVFTDGRIQWAQDQLTNAENALLDFYQHNRTWQSSPSLTVEEGRFRRQVDMRQDVYTTLVSQGEQAAINEVKNTPVLTIVSAPIVPALRSWPMRKLLVLLAAFVGLLASSAFVVIKQRWDAMAVDDPNLSERAIVLWSDVTSTLKRRLRHPFRRPQ